MELPFALTDDQLHSVMMAAQPFDPSKRGTFLERVAAELRRLGLRYPTDDDVARAVRVALTRLQQAPAA